MAFFNEWHIANERTCNAPWSGMKGGERFFCAFCRHKFVVGDKYMPVYTNDLSNAPGNPLTCESCFVGYGELEGLRNHWIALWYEYKTRFKWWDHD